jgi:hypothetical protein
MYHPVYQGCLEQADTVDKLNKSKLSGLVNIFLRWCCHWYTGGGADVASFFGNVGMVVALAVAAAAVAGEVVASGGGVRWWWQCSSV